MLECKKNGFGIGMQKGLKKQPLHIFTSHIGHIKVAFCPHLTTSNHANVDTWNHKHIILHTWYKEIMPSSTPDLNKACHPSHMRLRDLPILNIWIRDIKSSSIFDSRKVQNAPHLKERNNTILHVIQHKTIPFSIPTLKDACHPLHLTRNHVVRDGRSGRTACANFSQLC